MLLPNWQPNHWIYVSFLNTLRLWQSCYHFTDNIFKCIFLNENVWIWVKISIKLVPGGPVSNIPTLVQIMAWCRSGAKPLSELMMVSLLKHICSTWPQWVKQQLPALHNEPQMCEKVKKFTNLLPFGQTGHGNLVGPGQFFVAQGNQASGAAEPWLITWQLFDISSWNFDTSHQESYWWFSATKT